MYHRRLVRRGDDVAVAQSTIGGHPDGVGVELTAIVWFLVAANLGERAQWSAWRWVVTTASSRWWSGSCASSARGSAQRR